MNVCHRTRLVHRQPKSRFTQSLLFSPFLGVYHTLALDQTGYQWTLVAGPDRNYQWILARNKTLSSTIRDQLASQAKKMGFTTDNRIWDRHTRADN